VRMEGDDLSGRFHMRPTLLLAAAACIAGTVFAGFKVKLVKPKKPEQYQVVVTSGAVQYAGDLLLSGKDQKNYFYKELTPSNIIALRLAVFNSGRDAVVLPLEDITLFGPDGGLVPMLAPEAVAQAVLEGLVVTAQAREETPVSVSPSVRSSDPRSDPTDPRYDPRRDPNDPSYDPNDPRNRGYGRTGTYGPWSRPGVDVILNPGGAGAGGDLSRFERQLVEKDFRDKAHEPAPILTALPRDKFLYFSHPGPPAGARGFVLRIPPGKGIPEEVVLRF